MDKMTQFRITYDGQALASHEMDARELAPALLAMADLLEASVRALHGDRARTRVNVKGSFKTGCFHIDFNTTVDLLRAARDLFAGNEVAALANAAAVLGLLGLAARQGGFGLAQLLKWLRGRQITRIDMRDGGGATIHVEAEQCEVEVEVVVLLRDLAVRQAFDRMMAPLERDGIELFAAGNEAGTTVTVTRAERAYFSPPAAKDQLSLQEVRRMALSIVSVAFLRGNAWRFSDGASTLSAEVSDEDFLAGVGANEIVFAKGDVLVCEVRVTQWQIAAGVRTDYEVVRVLEHRKAVREAPKGSSMPQRGAVLA